MKKAQIKMMETIAVIIVFFMIIMFALIFFANGKMKGVQQSLKDKTFLQAVEVQNVIYHLPELQCSVAGVVCESTLDTVKLTTLSEKTENCTYDPTANSKEFLCLLIIPQPPALMKNPDLKSKYYDLFKFTSIEVHVLYSINSRYYKIDSPQPITPTTKISHMKWTIYDHPPPSIKTYQSKILPVALYNPRTTERYFGYMNITVYE